MPAYPPTSAPQPLPEGLLVDLAARRGVGLLLDYDGTLAEIVSDPSKATPLPEIPSLIDQIAVRNDRIVIAIVTGRRINEIIKLLGVRSLTLFSGVHGLEVSDRDGKTHFTAAALACKDDLDRVRQWLNDHVPTGHGFWIEDKEVAIGLHYRRADPEAAVALGAQFAEFIVRETPSLKLLHLKMIFETMPKSAGKNLAVANFKQRFPHSFVSVYFGDDTTDEDAFAALEGDDVGVLVGAPRASRARYCLRNPQAVADELRVLATFSENRISVRSG